MAPPGSDAWYIAVDGSSHGPFAFARLLEAAADGRLRPDMLVWSPGMSEWTAAQNVQGLFQPPPPPAPSAPSARVEPPLAPKEVPAPVPGGAERAPAQAVAPERPGAWRRFFARWIDVQLSGAATIFCAAVVLGLASPRFAVWAQSPTNGTLFGLLAMPLAFVVDAAVVAIFGNSLGKALLGLHVRRTSGEPLAFADYAKRNLNVWLFGLGLCIPVLAVFTMLYQASCLQNGGNASYDVGRYRVDAYELMFWQAIVAFILVVGTLSGMVYLSVSE